MEVRVVAQHGAKVKQIARERGISKNTLKRYLRDPQENLKDELAIRPIFHQREDRIEAHIFVAFLVYCLRVTLRQQLKAHAPGLTARQTLEKLERTQLLDVRIPSTDGRELLFNRYTGPADDQLLLLAKLG